MAATVAKWLKSGALVWATQYVAHMCSLYTGNNNTLKAVEFAFWCTFSLLVTLKSPTKDHLGLKRKMLFKQKEKEESLSVNTRVWKCNATSPLSVSELWPRMRLRHVSSVYLHDLVIWLVLRLMGSLRWAEGGSYGLYGPCKFKGVSTWCYDAVLEQARGLLSRPARGRRGNGIVAL